MSNLDAVVSALGFCSARPPHLASSNVDLPTCMDSHSTRSLHIAPSHADPLARAGSLSLKNFDPSGVLLDFDASSLPSIACIITARTSDPFMVLSPRTCTTPRLEPPPTSTFTESSFGMREFSWRASRPSQQASRDRSASPPAREPQASGLDRRPARYDDARVSSLSRTGHLETDMSNVRRAAAMSLHQKKARKPVAANNIAPSAYRPHVPADQRLLLWTAPKSLEMHREFELAGLSLDTQRRAFEWHSRAHVADTRGSYGAGLLRFHQWCDINGITEDARLPASRALLIGFVSDAIGTCTGKCIRNWLNGLHLWHTYNGLAWHGDEAFLPGLKKAADKAGAKHKRPERGPVTKKHLRALRAAIDVNSNFGAATWASALARLPSLGRDSNSQRGQVLVRTRRDATYAHCTTGTRGGELILTETTGEDADICPIWAWRNHTRVNHSPPPGTPLFAFRSQSAWRPLTKDIFLRTTDAIYKAGKLDTVFGHSYRIGGALALLVAGVAPEIIMKLGGWSSLCFLIYWRRLQLILPLAVTRAWDARIREFAESQGHAGDVDSLVIDI
ncbi:hypothetical protein B0H12DRAFT_1237040 [Mycena haematopus]|nr:hypothetical protein B0H12DRAFT_1237040 [Mycena haematopus]